MGGINEHNALSSENAPPLFAPIPTFHPHLSSTFPPFASSTFGSIQNTPTPTVRARDQPTSVAPTVNNTQASLSLAFADGVLLMRTNAATMKWELQCPDCKAWVSTGLSSESTLGNRDGHFASLVAHRQGKKCAQEWKSRVAGLDGSDTSLGADGEIPTQQLPPRTSSAPPDSLSPGKRAQNAWYSAHAHDFDDAYSG